MPATALTGCMACVRCDILTQVIRAREEIWIKFLDALRANIGRVRDYFDRLLQEEEEWEVSWNASVQKLVEDNRSAR